MTLLEVANVTKRFGGVVAVNSVSFTATPAQITGLFGPNGAGKTTLFNIIAGADAPDAGRVSLEGRDVTRLPVFRRARLGIGRTFQIVRPFRELTVLENLLAAVPRDTRATLAPMTLLARVGLGGRANDPAGALTLGMLKRLEVARALALAPRLLLLDEPLAGLTSREATEMLAFVAELKSQMGVILVEHNVRLALPVCDRALVLAQGAIIAAGTPDEIRRDPAVITAYLGSEAAA
jgi:branched-chain amino acid transport system ATP-binding protein